MQAAPGACRGCPIRRSHERYDGAGYPDGLSGEQIPLESRILFACDAFDAMTSERPYAPALSTAEALDELKRNAGGQFDPRGHVRSDRPCPASRKWQGFGLG